MEQAAIHACQEALVAVLWLSAPATLAALVVGLIVAVAQAATQIQEQTVSYVPKLLAVCLALVLFGSWMLGQLVRLAVAMFEQVPAVGEW
jgi:flagellar biosynthetic protein FliQ